MDEAQREAVAGGRVMTAECEHSFAPDTDFCCLCEMKMVDIIAALRAERDAYKRAKAENDERFMLDAAEQRARAERAERALTNLGYLPDVWEAMGDDAFMAGVVEGLRLKGMGVRGKTLAEIKKALGGQP